MYAMPDRIHVDLELEPGSEPIAGELAVADDQPVAFVGWMQLTRLLDRIAGSPAAVDARVPPSS
jgi:hypothetical protein